MTTETPSPVLATSPLGPLGPDRGIRIAGRTFSPRWLLSMVWLFFLNSTFATAFGLESPVRRVVSVTLLVGFCFLYGYAFSTARFSRWRGDQVERIPLVVVGILAAAITLAVCLLVGEDGLALTVYDAVMAVMLLATGPGLSVVAFLVVATEVSSRVIDGWVQQDSLAFSILLASVAVWGITQMINRNFELAQAQQQIARLAVARERDRFARDLHDLLGHSLTVITMKSELAGRLVPLDPARAETEIAEVERLARDALADVRAAVAGYREVTLATELVSARTALDAAGISAELPSALDEVPGERRELLGWAVREGVTNVVRHSGARHCRIALSRASVEIVDDGDGLPEFGSGDAVAEGARFGGSGFGGNGLRGLRERAEAAGASVVVGRGDDGRGFRLKVGW